MLWKIVPPNVVIAFVCKHKRGHVVGLALVVVDATHAAYKNDAIRYRRVGRCEVRPDVYENAALEQIEITIV